MPEARYFLHIRDKGHLVEDPEGVLSDSVEAMWAHAVAAAKELLTEGLLQGPLTAGRHFEVVDEHGNLRDVLPFHALLALECE